MQKSVFIIIAIFIFAACSSSEELCPDIDFAETSIFNRDHYLIVEAILEEEFENSELTHLSQESHSMPDSARFSLYFKSDKLGFGSDIIATNIDVNSASYDWGDTFDSKLKLISEEELLCLSDINRWFGFGEKYTESYGYLKFGRPLVINDNEALVTFELLCGPLCSSGYTGTLTKKNGHWNVRDLILVWIS